MQIIDISAIDVQFFSMTLDGVSYRFRLKDTGLTGVFLDVYRENKPLIMGILCLDRLRLIRSVYKKFPGDLMFFDLNGFTNPQFTYFGTRFLLAYLSEDELTIGS